jgi:ribosomal protein S18 acetylase RimI-like enzyme
MIYRNSSSKAVAFIFCSTKHTDMYKRFLKQNLSALIKFKSLFFLLIKTVFKKFFLPGFSYYECELVNIAVDKDNRGKGIAKMLISSAEELMRKMKIPEYFLQVLATNSRAVNLYKKLGFELVESIRFGNDLKYLMRKVN